MLNYPNMIYSSGNNIARTASKPNLVVIISEYTHTHTHTLLVWVVGGWVLEEAILTTYTKLSPSKAGSVADPGKEWSGGNNRKVQSGCKLLDILIDSWEWRGKVG